MRIPFTKMHGCANDYIYINCFETEIADPNTLSTKMSPRHFSVGSDGLVLICPSDIADAKMRMFNLDGSEGKMCGNAIRCIGKYLYDNKIVNKTNIDIETLSGIKHLALHVENDFVKTVTVDMGVAEIVASKIPVIFDKEIVLSEPLTIDEKTYKMTCVSMGNPHAVSFVDDVQSLNLEKIGPLFENHPMFPERVNTEFIHVINRNELDMRVWERGSGETFACGTGACAAATAAIMNKYCDFDSPITIHLIGGDLMIRVTRDYRVFMTGSATKVYDGVYDYEN